MSVTAQDVADYVSEHISGIRGNAEAVIEQARPISLCVPAALTFLKPTVFDVQPVVRLVKGAVLICSTQHSMLMDESEVTCLVTDNPRLVFMRAVSRFFSLKRPPPGIHPTAVVDPTSTVDPSATVSAHCFIDANCSIGPRSILFPNVTLYSNVRLAADVVVHAGTVIGADGFGYERNEEGELEKFPHIGGVLIEEGVEIGSNTSVDRGTLGDTIIRTGARIDNQCHISHNVEIGKHTAVIAQTMIGGSVKVGDYSWLAPSAIVMNQIRVGDHATVGMAAAVVKNVRDGETVMGSPAMPASEFRAQRDLIRKLASSST